MHRPLKDGILNRGLWWIQLCVLGIKKGNEKYLNSQLEKLKGNIETLLVSVFKKKMIIREKSTCVFDLTTGNLQYLT